MNFDCNSYVCRVCGYTTETLEDIFKSNSNGYVTATAIQDLLQTKVVEGDAYPKFVCRNCNRKIRDSMKFRDLFLQSKSLFDHEISKRQVHTRISCRTGSADIGDYLQVVVKEEFPFEKHDRLADPISKDICSGTSEGEIITDDYNPTRHGHDTIKEKIHVTEKLRYLNKDEDATTTENGIDLSNVKVKIEVSEGPVQIEEDGLCKEDPKDSAVSNRVNKHVVSNSLHAHAIENIFNKDVKGMPDTINKSHDPYSSETCVQVAFRGSDEEVCLMRNESSKGEKRNSKEKQVSSDKERDASERIEIKSYKCKMCPKTYARRTSLKKHENFVHREKHFECKICHRKFAQRYDLRNHELRHLGEKNYACNQCDKKFVAALDLRRHQKIHNKDLGSKDITQITEEEKKDFKCSFCAKEFSTKSNLRNHERRHAVERRFECKTCHKTFIISRDLRIHEKRHLGDRKHACDQCNKRFLTTSELSTHKRNHNKVLRYFCDNCNRGFLYKGTLARHTMIHNNARPFKCDVCNASYSQMSNLRRHYLKHHTDQHLTILHT